MLQILNKQWHVADIDHNELKAYIASIYKKGDPKALGNYRPISLLNILIKILSSIVQVRLADGLDKYLPRTQFGFRRTRGTQEALHLIRRIIESGESTTSRLILVLLDWEKAFDRLTRAGLFAASAAG